MSFLRGLISYHDRDASVRRVRRNTIVGTIVVAGVVGATTGALVPTLGVIAASALMLLNFNGLVALSDSLVEAEAERPGALQLGFLAGRHVLLGIGLCAIVLTPGVGPIPVALGLTVLVVAILVEAIAQALSGAH